MPWSNETSLVHYEHWLSFLAWLVIFGAFIVFLPLHRKQTHRSTSVYLAFVLASAFEMFGIPLSLYFVTWAFGVTLPLGVLWGHTLQSYLGVWAMYVGFALNFIGGSLIYLGWKVIHRNYWSKAPGEGTLVTSGIYSFMRHPQYTGFLLMTGGLIHWTTIPLLIMWPLLIYQYYRLAKREEQELAEEFSAQYQDYKNRVPMFFPFT
jgi:protein-S-isoprenylcysteine O-methyltransferase Ste14